MSRCGTTPRSSWTPSRAGSTRTRRSQPPPGSHRLLATTTREATPLAIEAGGAFCGSCSLQRIDQLARHADVGIGLSAEARGRGYGTDALRVLAQFGFARHNLHRLQLEVLAANAAAIASYRKVGFVEEGRRRQHAWVDGRYEDELVIGLLRDEWTLAAG